MDSEDPLATPMVAAAREYCELIEHLDMQDCDTCLCRMARLLPRLHAAVTALPRTNGDAVYAGVQTLDSRFDLFSRIRAALGERDAYLLEFDRSQEDRSGSLADDFTDIYFDLRFGLDLVESEPAQASAALASWRRSFDLHWGQHLVDAERQLYALTRGGGGGCK
jgi:hypothetical protein